MVPPIVRQPPARSTRPLAAIFTRQSGPGSEIIVWGGWVDIVMASLTLAGDTIPAQIVGQPPARPTRPLPDPSTRQSGLETK